MKKALFIINLLLISITAAYSQDDTYYPGDESTVTEQSQEAPPPLPDYVQPPCPGDGYYWTPGYWGWGTQGYFWVPGVWVLPPHPGLLWTPGYWGLFSGFFGWHPGYWGVRIGYYGGVNYGFGYFGSGFYGGKWDGNIFRYNTAVWHVNSNIKNVYVEPHNNPYHAGQVRYSFNGKQGVQYRPQPREHEYINNHYVPATKQQVANKGWAKVDKGQFAKPNNGKPIVNSMSKPNGQRYNQQGHAIQGPPKQRSGGGARSGGGGRGGKR